MPMLCIHNMLNLIAMTWIKKTMDIVVVLPSFIVRKSLRMYSKCIFDHD